MENGKGQATSFCRDELEVGVRGRRGWGPRSHLPRLGPASPRSQSPCSLSRGWRAEQSPFPASSRDHSHPWTSPSLRSPPGAFLAANWVLGGFLRHTRLQPLLPHALAHPPPAYPFCGPHVCRALTVGQAPCQARGGQGERAAGELGAAEAPTTRPPRPQPGDAPGGTSQRRWHPSPS